MPAAPFDLVASTVSSSQINIRWTDNSENNSDFDIECKKGIDGSWSMLWAPPLPRPLGLLKNKIR